MPIIPLQVAKRCIAAAFLAAMSLPALAQATDSLGVPGPIEFDGTSYALAWTAKPSETYTKQEYLPAGQTVERYEQMLLIETATGGAVTDAVRGQMEMLNQRKATDPLVNMDLIQNQATGEMLLDFMLSAKDAKGETIVEWNAYRYAPFKDASGKEGVLLFGISHRGYGDEGAKSFLGNLKTLRPARINALAKATLPSPTQ